MPRRSIGSRRCWISIGGLGKDVWRKGKWFGGDLKGRVSFRLRWMNLRRIECGLRVLERCSVEKEMALAEFFKCGGGSLMAADFEQKIGGFRDPV